MLNACLAELCICTADFTHLFLPLGLFSLGSLLLIQYLHSIFRVDVTRATPHCGSCDQVPRVLLSAFHPLEPDRKKTKFLSKKIDLLHCGHRRRDINSH